MKKQFVILIAYGLVCCGCTQSIPTSDRVVEPISSEVEASHVDQSRSEGQVHKTHNARRVRNEADIDFEAPPIEFVTESALPNPMLDSSESAGIEAVSANREFMRLPPPADLRADQSITRAALSVVSSLPPPPPRMDSSELVHDGEPSRD